MRRTILPFGISLLACGGGGSSGSGVQGSLVISQLTQKQRTAVCQAEVRYSYASSTTAMQECTLEAVSETTSIAECNAYVETCLREEDAATISAQEKQELADCTDLEGEYLNCEHTVAEFEDCYKKQRPLYERAALEASCRDAGDDGGDDPGYASDDCETVLDSCYSK